MVVLNVLIKNENPNICGTGGQRVKLHISLQVQATLTFTLNSFFLNKHIGTMVRVKLK